MAGRKSSASNIKMPDVNALFGLEDSNGKTEAKIVEIALDQLYSFDSHPFRVLDDEKMQETIESVREHGIICPLIVRQGKENGYEIIAGHRRKRACELLGLKTVPCFIRNLTDEEATITMVDSNIQREELLYSEKAYAYKDGRPAGSRSYMWVYRTGRMYTDRQIVLYEYQKTRNASHPREFLKNFSGVCVTDGCQVYHTVENEREDLKIAGCWSHARRRFDEAVKALPKAKQKDSRAYLALTMVQAIYREEKLLKDLPAGERKIRRQLSVRPLVEAYFVWVRENLPKVPQKSKTWEGFSYSLNQEKYLKVFLDDGEVPMDNNAAEQSIRGFCIGRKNWVMIDTAAGAKSSAIIYSITETAKANNLKPYDYFEYLLTEIPKHLDDTDRSFLDDLLPWSPNLPANCRKPGKEEVK